MYCHGFKNNVVVHYPILTLTLVKLMELVTWCMWFKYFLWWPALLKASCLSGVSSQSLKKYDSDSSAQTSHRTQSRLKVSNLPALVVSVSLFPWLFPDMCRSIETKRGWWGGGEGRKEKKDNRVVHSVICEREEDSVSSEHYKYKRSQSSNYSHLHWTETKILLDAQ